MKLKPLYVLSVAVFMACAAGATRPTPDQPVRGAPQTGPPLAAEPGAAPRISTRPPRIASLPDTGSAWVIFGQDTVVVEVASTSQERERGLMHRERLPDGTGMLFVFGREATRSFWMDNTLVALDIAYMDANRSIVDIQQMEPETTRSHTSAAPAQYALEVPAGWFAAHGVAVGDVAEFVMGR